MLFLSKLHIGITTYTSSARPISVLLIFEIEEINDASFLKANFLSNAASLVALIKAGALLGAVKPTATNVF